MSLGVVIKGTEGVVLAADSRVTLFSQVPNPQSPGQVVVLPIHFDNATKLLRATGKNFNFVGAVTYGLGAFLTAEGPRTIQGFMPEFEEHLKKSVGDKRPSILDFAKALSDFFSDRWNALMGRPANQGEEIYFIVAGYDTESSAYGRTYMFVVPNSPVPAEQNAGPGPNQFGITWGGQADLVFRMLFGFDPGVPQFLSSELHLSGDDFNQTMEKMKARFAPGIPYQALPLQDCVDLATFLLKSTIDFQAFRMMPRGVGGLVEVATITRVDGFQFVAQKRITAR